MKCLEGDKYTVVVWHWYDVIDVWHCDTSYICMFIFVRNVASLHVSLYCI